MSERPSPTPSEDNRRNVREETAILALDRALNNTEQSREDLLNSFTYLNKADVNKATQKGVKELTPADMKSIMSNILSKGQMKGQGQLQGQGRRMDTGLDINKSNGQKIKETAQVECKLDGDGIEEEILDAGNVEGRLSSARIIKAGTNLKVDNFIDNAEDDTEEGTDPLDSYIASFGEGTSRPSGTAAKASQRVSSKDSQVIPTATISPSSKDSQVIPTATISPSSKDPQVIPTATISPSSKDSQVIPTATISPSSKDPQVIPTATISPSSKDPQVTPRTTLDESDTDKLLMNFLADLQNEENSQKGQKLAARTEASAENSIDAFIHKNKTQKEEETVDFSDDGDDAAMALVDNSNETNITVVVNHEELDEITKPDCSDNTIKPKVNPKMVMDSEGNLCEEQDIHVCNSDNAEHNEAVSNIVFPGEIVAEEMSTQQRNDRLLGFKVTYRDPTDETQENNRDNTTCDEVEPFHLDTEFDYDNVVLTPKYSEADMERLQKLIQTSAALV